MRRLAGLGGCLLALALAALPASAQQPRPRGAPTGGDPMHIAPLPPIAPDAMCQAETISAAFGRLGALSTLPLVTQGIAETVPAGLDALAGYCTSKAEECTSAAAALRPRIGEKPPSCEE
jgi:hypothetical protein